jgi:hypothetical protein
MIAGPRFIFFHGSPGIPIMLRLCPNRPLKKAICDVARNRLSTTYCVGDGRGRPLLLDLRAPCTWRFWSAWKSFTELEKETLRSNKECGCFVSLM